MVVLASLVVLVIAQKASDPLSLAFERAARGVLGENARVQMIAVDADPPDAESAARGAGADGVIELSWTNDGTTARIHCYLARERRWVDREISFGATQGNAEREATERGRLLGFAAATMFAEDQQPDSATPSTPAAPSPSALGPTKHGASTQDPPAPHPLALRAPGRRVLEFAGIASSGIGGTAAGLGAMAAVRLAWTGPVWVRLLVAGRTGNVPEAQAATRSVLLGGGLALAALPATSRVELGARLDAFAHYFEASHLSEDDMRPDKRSRWLVGADCVAEGGFRFAGSASVLGGGGLEAMFGQTDLYTHGTRAAVIPPLRIVAEIAIQVGF